MRRLSIAVLLLGCQGCIATALGLDRDYATAPHPTSVPAEPPRPAQGGCLRAYTSGCSAHPHVPNEWTSTGERRGRFFR
jgi:hypothetical protein